MRRLVNASEHFLAGKSRDHPLDLPPVAEADDIFPVAAFLRPSRGFKASVIAETLDEFGGIGKSRPSGDEGRVHASSLTAPGFPTADEHRQRSANHLSCLAQPPPLCHATPMAQRNTLGGGCFLIIPMLIGFIAGMATGNAYRGVLIGTAIGIALAVAVWLIDRRRG